jgi:hypothetical protein
MNRTNQLTKVRAKPKGQATGNNAILSLSRTIKTLSDIIFLEGAPEDAR